MIAGKRALVAAELLTQSKTMKKSDFESISVNDLRCLFYMYDRHFLNSWFENNHYHGMPKHKLSRRMTRAAGTCSRRFAKVRYHYEITISVDFLFNHGRLGDSASANGIVTHSSLEALQAVYEHELCHLLEFLYFGDSECKKARFKALANQIFGHTSSYHDLPTYSKIAHMEKGILIGDQVRFDYEGRILQGRVNRITKRATVETVDLEDNRHRHLYYVPIGKLIKVTAEEPALPVSLAVPDSVIETLDGRTAISGKRPEPSQTHAISTDSIEGRASQQKEAIIYFKLLGLEVMDNRNKGGVLWIYGSKEQLAKASVALKSKFNFDFKFPKSKKLKDGKSRMYLVSKPF